MKVLGKGTVQKHGSRFDSKKDPGQRLLIPKLQAPPDLKIGPNKSQIRIINDQNVGLINEVILI